MANETGPSTIKFGNVQTSRGWSFTYAPGTSPSTCFVTVPAYGSAIPTWIDDLTLIDPSYDEFTFKKCLLAEPQLSSTTRGGHIWTLPILDRRWMWQYGSVYGHYNKRRKDGSYDSQRTVAQLVDILCKAMGESVYTADLPPNLSGFYPEKVWIGQSAASELEQLCQEIGCMPTLNPFSDKLEITRIDVTDSVVGAPLFAGSTTLIDPQRPDKFVGEGGPTLFQAIWQVEPVGKEPDGTWRNIESLSYKRVPWTIGEALGGFGRYTDQDTYTVDGREYRIRDLAAAHIFKSFRITGSKMLRNTVSTGGGINIVPDDTGGETIDWLDANDKPEKLKRDILFLNRLAKEEVTAGGELITAPARVFANYYRQNHGQTVGISLYPHSFSFDTEEGIITFGEVMFKQKADKSGLEAAEIEIECAFQAGRDRRWHRCRSDIRDTHLNKNTALAVYQRPEVQMTAIYGQAGSLTTSKTSVQDELDYYLDAEEKRFLQKDAGSWTFPNLRRYYATGSIAQVTWSGGGGSPCTTVVSRGQRHERFNPPHEEIVRRRQLASKQEVSVHLAKQAAQAAGGAT